MIGAVGIPLAVKLCDISVHVHPSVNIIPHMPAKSQCVRYSFFRFEGDTMDRRTKEGRELARSKYETNVQPFLENIEWWLQQGATIEEIAGRLDLAQSSIKLYLAKGRAGEKPYSDFSSLFDKVHVNLDDSVEAALYKKTQGYNAKVAKNVKVKCVDYDEVTGKKIREYEEIKEVFDEVHIPADTNAQIFWKQTEESITSIARMIIMSSPEASTGSSSRMEVTASCRMDVRH
jgi:hypothetical protein